MTENYFQKCLKAPSPILKLYNLIHGLAESSYHLGDRNIAHNTKLYNDDYYVLLLSSYSGHLKANTILTLFLEHLMSGIHSK